MKVLFVVNNFCVEGNGLSASARRTVQGLRASGVDVRVLSQKGADWELPEVRIPVFDSLIRRQGYTFAKSVKSVIRDAVRWADLIHIEEPFWLQVVTCRIARQEGVPCVGTYHLHPENLFSSVHLRKSLWFNCMTMLFWRNTVFNNCLILQCPTENVRKRLERWHFKSALRVISNGMIPVEKREEAGSAVLGVFGGSDSIEQDVFTVISTGRYSVEKDQITLLRAMKYSRHASRIRLILAGRGPEEKKLKRFAQMLLRKNYIVRPVEFLFCSRKELSEIYAQCKLYVHCAVVEVEGLGCTEAISEGLVPVIAEARLSGTSQFAFSDKNLFRARDARDLARKIDYWFEHRDELEKQSAECRTIGEKYSFDKTVRAIMQMYEDALSIRKESI